MNASENKTGLVEMNSEEMESVSGGAKGFDNYEYCPNCKMKTLVRRTKGGAYICSICRCAFT